MGIDSPPRAPAHTGHTKDRMRAKTARTVQIIMRPLTRGLLFRYHNIALHRPFLDSPSGVRGVVVLNSSCNLYAPASRFVSIDQQHIRHHKRTATPIMRAAIFFSPDNSLLFGAVYLLTTAAQRPCLAACIFLCPFFLQLFLHFFTVDRWLCSAAKQPAQFASLFFTKQAL